MKKILTIILFLTLSTLVLVGCGEVDYTVRIESGGARIYRYTVRLDSREADVDKQRAAVRTVFTYYRDNVDRATFTEKDPNELILEITYSDLTDYYIANGITGDEPSEPSDREKEGLLFQKYYTTLFVADEGTFEHYALAYLDAYDARFSTAYVAKAYEYAYGGKLTKPFEQVVKHALEDSDAFSALRALVRGETLREEAQAAAYIWLKELGYDFTKVEAYFNYSMVYKNVKGVDPDEVYEEDGQTVYKWKLDPLADNEFTVTQTAPSVWVWEALAILSGLIVAAICVSVAVVRKKRKDEAKKEDDEVITSEDDAFYEEDDQEDFYGESDPREDAVSEENIEKTNDEEKNED